MPPFPSLAVLETLGMGGDDERTVMIEKSFPKDAPKESPTRAPKLPPRCPKLSSSIVPLQDPHLVSGTLKTPELSSGPPEAPKLTSRAATMTSVLAFGTSHQVPKLPPKRLAKSTEMSSSSSGPSSGPPSLRNKLPPKCPKYMRTVPQPNNSNSESSSSFSRSPQSQSPSPTLKSSSPSLSPKKSSRAAPQCGRGLPGKKKFFKFIEATPVLSSPTSSTSLPTPPYTTRAQIGRYRNIVPIFTRL
jgi:hypothetical protein